MKAFNTVMRIATVGVLMGLGGLVSAQQTYPNRPIRFIVPYPPGGSVDPLVRLFAPKLTESWGQPVIVDNRGGGNTIIGTDALAKSAPDGYTIGYTGGTTIVNALVIPAMPYNLITDLAPIATISTTQYVMVLHPSVPANNLQEFIALARSRPGQINYGSVGTGGTSHLGTEMFNIMAGVKMQRIPYKGSAPMMIDLVGGQIQVGFNTPISTVSHIKSGKLKAIATSGEKRQSILPLVPTFAESGLPGFEMSAMYGITAPAGTPKEIIDKLAAEFGKILTMPDVKEQLAKQGMDPFFSTPEQFAALIKTEMAKFAKVIKVANIKVE